MSVRAGLRERIFRRVMGEFWQVIQLGVGTGRGIDGRAMGGGRLSEEFASGWICEE